MYEERFYRNFEATGTKAFQVTLKESDLFIRADRDLSAEAKSALITARSRIEGYIEDNPLFERSLIPLRPDSMAPRIVREMIDAGILADVGPMAAVAGAVAQFVGRKLASSSNQVIVENGGDLFLKLSGDLTIGIYAGKSPLSGRIGLKIKATDTPCGLCTSSGTIGHSHSEGDADTVTIFASDAALADAAATATGNQVKSEKDVPKAVEYAMNIAGVRGVCIIRKDKLGIQGDLELVKLVKDI
jgi:hypothetical protein